LASEARTPSGTSFATAEHVVAGLVAILSGVAAAFLWSGLKKRSGNVAAVTTEGGSARAPNGPESGAYSTSPGTTNSDRGPAPPLSSDSGDTTHTFYVTLAQVTAGLLAILTAVAVGYFVFLRERATSFDDRIFQQRLQIRDELLRLGPTETPLTAAADLLPPAFSDAYRSRNPGQRRADLVLQAAFELLNPSSNIEAALAEVRNTDSFEGPYPGRVYFWILNEALNVMASGTWETTTKPDGAFPSASGETGFDAWRQDFDKARSAITVLSLFKEQMQADFRNFIAQNQARYPNLKGLETLVPDAFFQRVSSIQNLVSDIDRQRLLKAQYSFNSGRFIFSMVCAFLTGVALPFTFLIWNFKINRFGATCMLATVILFLGLATSQLGSSATGRQLSDREYITARWYRPMTKELRMHEEKLSRGAFLDRDFLMDAAYSADRKQFSAKLASALDAYLAAAEAYNRSALPLTQRVVEAIRKSPELIPAIGKLPQTGNSIGLNPIEVLERGRDAEIAKLAKNLATDPALNVSVETEMPRWRHVDVVIIGRSLGGDTSKLVKALQAIRDSLSQSNEAVEFSRARTAAIAAERRLKSELPD
jgi:hypothetical protein